MSILDNLPDVSFAEKDAHIIETEVLSNLERELGRKLYPGDPLRLLMLTFIKYLALQRNLIDFAGKQNLLKYAQEGYIQNLGALLGVSILNPACAVTTLKITLSKPLEGIYMIRAGTRATAGDEIYFAIDKDTEIPIGETIIFANATCTTPGTVGNGYLPGQLNILADPFPYNASITNISTTQGGSDREDLESFRERIRLAPESFSTAGPYGAYEYWAKTASQSIMDVSVTSPNPGEVEIVPLLDNGEIPSQSILDSIYVVCNDDTRRPLTDLVIVRPPEKVPFQISVKYWISRKDATFGISIQDKINRSVQEYILWQKSKLGRDLNPSKLIEFIMGAGAKRVEVMSPTFTVLQHYEVAVALYEASEILYGGLEDD